MRYRRSKSHGPSARKYECHAPAGREPRDGPAETRSPVSCPPRGLGSRPGRSIQGRNGSGRIADSNPRVPRMPRGGSRVCFSDTRMVLVHASVSRPRARNAFRTETVLRHATDTTVRWCAGPLTLSAERDNGVKSTPTTPDELRLLTPVRHWIRDVPRTAHISRESVAMASGIPGSVQRDSHGAARASRLWLATMWTCEFMPGYETLTWNPQKRSLKNALKRRHRGARSSEGVIASERSSIWRACSASRMRDPT